MRAFRAGCARAAPCCQAKEEALATPSTKSLAKPVFPPAQATSPPAGKAIAKWNLLVAREQPGPGHGQLCPTKPTVSRATLPSGWPARQGFTRVGRDEKPPATSLFLKTEAGRFRQPLRLSWRAHSKRPSPSARPRSKWCGSGVRAPGRFRFTSSPPRRPRPSLPGLRRRNSPGSPARSQRTSKDSPEAERRPAWVAYGTSHRPLHSTAVQLNTARWCPSSKSCSHSIWSTVETSTAKFS